jgi:Amidase
MRFARIVSSRIGCPLLAVLLATAAVLSPSPTAQAGPGTLTLGELSLDAITIPELQDRMQSGALTAVDLTQAYLNRIAEVNDEVRAVLSVNAHALDEAAHSDVIRAQQGQRSEMEGIPVLLKDNVDAEGNADDGRFPRAPAQRAGRRDDHPQIARRRRNRDRQGQPLRVGQLPREELDQRLERGRRADGQPLRPRPQRVLFLQRIRCGCGGVAGPGSGWHGDERLDRLPVGHHLCRRAEADPRHGQP